MLFIGCLARLVKLIVVLVFVGLIAGGVYYYTKVHPERAPWKGGMEKVQDKVQETKLGAEVKAALGLRETLKGSDIDVSVEKDVVTLRGRVVAADAVDAAERVASAVPGVRQVVNFLKVAASTGVASADDRTMGERLDDEALELRIRAAFKLDKTLEGVVFTVTARRKTVIITSASATADQKKRALEVTRTLEGVAAVESR